MREVNIQKRCPICEKEYSEEDNYCGDDGSVLEQVQAASVKRANQT